MAGHIIQNIRVFVATPGDLDDVRTAVEQVANELNQIWRTQDKRLDVLRWQDVTFPVGSAPEKTILEQLHPKHWDIFIGVFWHRFGTSTGDINATTNEPYRSGTEQEFFTALEQLQQRDLPMLFYRRDTPVRPSLIDAEQLAYVHKFFKEFRPGGTQVGYIYNFDELDTFKQYIRRDLSFLAGRM